MTLTCESIEEQSYAVDLNGENLSETVTNQINHFSSIIQSILEDDEEKKYTINISKGHKGTLNFEGKEYPIIDKESPLISVFTEDGKLYFDEDEQGFLDKTPTPMFGENDKISELRRNKGIMTK